MWFMYGMVKRLFTNIMINVEDLLEARINGRILGAFISKDYMTYDDVQEWIQGQTEDLFYVSGYVRGLAVGLPPIYPPMKHYTKAQGMATCYYKFHWATRVWIEVEGTLKNLHKVAEGWCTCLESPKARKFPDDLDETKICYPDERGDR